MLGRRGSRSSVERSSSLVEALAGADGAVHWSLHERMLKAPRRCMAPDVMAMKFKKRGTSKPVDGSVKNVDARRERIRGDKPKRAMLAPEAAPRY